jgi:hypothetical protein
MTEREVVVIKIISPGEWQSKFSNVISRIHKNTARRRSEEIEADILSAVKEVRKEKYGVRVIIIGYRSSLVCQIRST